MKTLLIAAIFAACATAAGAETPIQPGYWESTNHLSFVLEQDTTKRQCITPALAESYLTGPANNHYTCVYGRKREVGGGKVALAGQCVDKDGHKIDVDITGVYTKTSFDLNAQLAGNLYGLPLSGAATTKARRIGDVCPVADTK